MQGSNTKQDPRSDEGLVDTCNYGQLCAAAKAFETLYLRHKDYVLRVALRLTAATTPEGGAICRGKLSSRVRTDVQKALKGNMPRRVTGLFPILILVLAQACTSAGKPATRHTLGVYGDWTAYRLEDGALEVCYVETPFIRDATADPEIKEVRMQVSNRAFNPGADLIRFTATHVLPRDHVETLQRIEVGLVPISSISLAALFDPEGYDLGGPVDDELVGEMTSGKITEVTLTQHPEDWEDKDGTRLGSYSMDGFTDAYEAISRACPLRPGRPDEAVSRPVRIDGYSIVEGPPRYYQFSLTGSFFEAGKADELIIRGIPGKHSELDGIDEDTLAQYSPERHFYYGAQRWEFYRNGAVVDTLDHADRHEMTGICLDPDLARLKLFVYAFGNPGVNLSVYYEPDEGIVAEGHYAKDSFGPDRVDCLDNEHTWKEGEAFRPCLCAGSAGNELYRTTLSELRSDIRQAGDTNRSRQSRTIGDTAFSALLSRIDRLAPFVWWDAYSLLDVQRFESAKYAIVSIAFQDRTSPYGSFQRVFVRRLAEALWTAVFDQDSDRYGFNTATLHGFHDADTVDLEMCFVEGSDPDYQCQRYGEDERRFITVEDWLRRAGAADVRE